MDPSLLFIIASDPRSSHRPAEAIRIAAGVGAWKKAEITLYLREAAVLALSESSEDLLDEENFRRHLPMMRELGRPIYVQRGAPLLANIEQAAWKLEAIDDTQLAALAARSAY